MCEPDCMLNGAKTRVDDALRRNDAAPSPVRRPPTSSWSEAHVELRLARAAVGEGRASWTSAVDGIRRRPP